MGSHQEIDYKKFIQLAEDNSIEKLVVVNQAEARVYIKKSELSRDEFKDISQDAFSLNQPHYTFNIGTVDALEGRLKDINEARAQEEKLRAEEHTSELQSRGQLGCRWLLEINNIKC